MFSQTEFMNKQKEIMGNIVDRGAHQLQPRLLAEVKKVSDTIANSKVLGSADGWKSKAGGQKNVNKKYGGDWLEIQDMARCTLVVETQKDYDLALIRLKLHFVSSNGFSVIEEKTKLANVDPGGYTGSTIFVASGGNKGEIQVNTPSMMYAKSLPEFRNALGIERENEIKAKYHLVPGGLGHLIYERFRDCRHTSIGQSYMNASKVYYSYFRSSPPNQEVGLQARQATLSLNLINNE